MRVRNDRAARCKRDLGDYSDAACLSVSRKLIVSPVTVLITVRFRDAHVSCPR